ncbi:hypothetical protein [Bulleidia extructa]
MDKQRKLDFVQSRKNIFQLSLRFLLSFSGVFLCLSLLSLRSSGMKTLVGSAIVSFIFWMYGSKGIGERKIEITPLLLSIGMALATLKKAWRTYSIPHIYLMMGSLAMLVGIYVLIDFLKSLFFELIDEENRKCYVWASIITLVLIVLFYSWKNQLFQQYDVVYSMDGGWVFNKMYPKLTYYDIRHPLISILYFPIYSFCSCILKLFQALNVTNLAIMIQAIQVQWMIMTAFMLSKITNNRWVKYLYMVSGPFVIHVFFFEKFSLLVFLLVLAVYFYQTQDHKAKIAVALATGSILTSCVIAIGCLLDNRKKFLARIVELGKTILFSLSFFVTFGKVHSLLHGYSEINSMRGYLGIISLKEKIYSYLNMIGSSFISISPDIQAKRIWWAGLTTALNYLAFIIIILVVLGWIRSRNKLEVRISAGWMLFSVILIVIAGWSITESPLFAIYFSWALMILVQNGLFCFRKVFPEKPMFIACCAIMLAFNASTTFQVVFSLL